MLDKFDKDAMPSKTTCSSKNGGDKLHVSSILSHDTTTVSGPDIAASISNHERTPKPQAVAKSEKTDSSSVDGRTSELNVNNTHLKESIKSAAETIQKDITSKVESSTRVADATTIKESNGGLIKSADTNNGEDDDELDFLLSLENPVQVKGQDVTQEEEEEDNPKTGGCCRWYHYNNFVDRNLISRDFSVM